MQNSSALFSLLIIFSQEPAKRDIHAKGVFVKGETNMTMEIQDKGKYYMYKKANWIQINGGTLTMSYVDESGEEHKEYGPIPDYIRVMDCE